MEVFAGDRQIPNPDFPQLIAPFPEPTDDLIYPHPTAQIHSPDIIPHRPISPPQKLRPIRCHARSPVHGGELVGTLAKGFSSDQAVGPLDGEFDCAVKLETKIDDVSNGGKASVVNVMDDQIRIGSGSFGDEGWEINGGEGVLENESRFFSVLSSSSDDGVDFSAANFEGPINRKRRKLKSFEHFLEDLVMKVMEKQEQMHNQLTGMIEKLEKERIVREEAWKQLEMERIRRDEVVRAQETSRSLALISFLQNLLGKEIQIPEPVAQPCPEENGVESTDAQADTKCDSIKKRWPEAEVQALIALRTALEHKFRVAGSKVCLWEEISVGMYSMGYNRTAKKCREKWENINKYFRTAGSGKKRFANGKTCPYFQNLDLLYKNELANPDIGNSTANNGDEAKNENDSGLPYTG